MVVVAGIHLTVVRIVAANAVMMLGVEKIALVSAARINKMKLILENWRKYLKEEKAAFHGFKMSPTQMRVSPQCDTPPDDNQWEAGEQGCPQFTNKKQKLTLRRSTLMVN